ncbi:MAG: formate/nitrite transporter family protein [Prevotella sp.]|nr:formate/nitrite transporter family protein [Prevotella sp.]
MPVRKPILAGMLIGLGAYGYLSLGGLAGAVIFAFGLIGVIALRVPLYTGFSGVVKKNQFGELAAVLLFNIVGSSLVGLAAHYCSDFSTALQAMVDSRLSGGAGMAFVKAIGCGMIIDLAVYIAKEKGQMLAVVFGVPLFIVCGFYHCVADVMYLTASWQWNNGILWFYPTIVIGNFIGCNIRRIMLGWQ